MLLNEILKTIPDEMVLSESSQPWLKKLLETLNSTIVELEINHECLSMSATGKQLREAIRALPAHKQVSLLNDCVVSYGRRFRRRADRLEQEEQEQKIRDRQLKHDLIKYGAFVFLFLSTVFVFAIIIISWKQNTAPDTEIASGLFNTLIEIIKLIFAVT